MADTSTAADTRIPWSSPTLRAILLSTLIVPLGVPLLSPILPAFRGALGITAPAAALLVTMYFVPGILLAPIIGLLADQYGRRRVLVPAIVVFGLSGATIGFVDIVTTAADLFAAVIALRIVQGTAAAGILILTATLVGDTFDGIQRNAVLGVNFGALGFGAAAFPLVGGALAPYGWQTPFYATLLALPVALFAATHLPEPHTQNRAGGLAYLRGALDAIPLGRAIVLYGATIAIEIAALGTVFTTLPFLLATEFGVPAVAIGAVITIETVVAALVAVQSGRVARYLANDTIIALGFTAYGVGLLAAWTAPSPLLIGITVIPMGVGVGLVLPSVDAAISAATPAEVRAGAFSLRTSSTFFGRATGPVIFTGIAAATGYRLLLLAAGVVVVGGGIAGTIMARSATN